jgi:WXG100 family type VII secretion target
MIKIDPGEVRSTGQQVLKKKQEMEDLIALIKRVMDDLQQNFTGKRSQAIYQEWQELHPKLNTSFQTLDQVKDLLQRAADQFEEVDMAR